MQSIKKTVLIPFEKYEKILSREPKDNLQGGNREANLSKELILNKEDIDTDNNTTEEQSDSSKGSSLPNQPVLEDQVDISNNSNINNTKADKNSFERDLTDAIDRKGPPKKDRFRPPPGIPKVKRGKIVRKQAKSPPGKKWMKY